MTDANTATWGTSAAAALTLAKEAMAEYYENLTNPEVCAWSTLCDALAVTPDELADKAAWWGETGEWKPLECAVLEVLGAKPQLLALAPLLV